MNDEIRSALYDKYIKPTEKKKESYVGIEIELPIVNLKKEATSHNVAKEAFKSALDYFGFTPETFDDDGFCHSAIDKDSNDIISFDCSYNNLELSFGKELNLLDVEARFKKYIAHLNHVLGKSNHIITGLGIQPFYDKCKKSYIPNGRYKMLEGYLRKAEEWKKEGGFHSYPGFGTYASSSQIQLDVKKDELVDTVRVFSDLEPIKSLLFANSLMLKDESDYLLTRDILWEYSTHGINPRNVGIFEIPPRSIDEFIDYISYTSIFCTEREGMYPFFYPIPIAEYFDRETIDAEYFDGEDYSSVTITPQKSDLDYLRTYKFLDLTKRGTIEYRSLCTQPLKYSFAGAAFQLGLANKLGELEEIFDKDTVLYKHGFSANELRRSFNRDSMPDFIDKKELTGLIIDIIELSKEGLVERGYGEERLLEPLYNRAETFDSPARHMRDSLLSGADIIDIIHSYAEL
ncbi:MAG: glutamylcysteine synthetase [Lachnospiraceae bacterium]|nr:glutamylcysteine synthetase [Lachnospiraceae bacterium]